MSHSASNSSVSSRSSSAHEATPVAAAKPPVARSPSKVTPEEYRKAKAELDVQEARHQQRVRSITHGERSDMENMPSLEELREERVRTAEQVRHHKDEQDSLALDIEGQQGAADVYQLAARVQRLEHFSERSNEHVEKTMADEIDRVLEEDRTQSSNEVLAYIQDLQKKRSATLERVVKAQEGQAKKKNNRAAKKEEEIQIAKEDEPAVAHTAENKDEAALLADKIKKFRALRTKLQADIVKEKGDAKKVEETMKTQIRNAELTNSRAARQCRELNNRNAAYTTNAQLLISQLNVEHYGMDNAPTTKQLMQQRKEREATPEDSPAENAQESSVARRSRAASISSRATNAKPPLVASKHTESQRNRDNATRQERDELSMSQRHNSENGSYQSSRRQSLSKPPLVASKPTAAQKSRDDATRIEREEQSVSRSRPRSQSISSDARPPAVAAKSTASSRSREVSQQA